MNMLGIIAELSEAEGCMHIEINVYMFWTWTHTLHGTVYIEKTQHETILFLCKFLSQTKLDQMTNYITLMFMFKKIDLN